MISITKAWNIGKWNSLVTFLDQRLHIRSVKGNSGPASAVATVTLMPWYHGCIRAVPRREPQHGFRFLTQRAGNLLRSRGLHTSTRMSFMDSTFCFFFFPFLWSLCSARKPSNLDQNVGRDGDCDRTCTGRRTGKERAKRTFEKTKRNSTRMMSGSAL